MNIETIPDLCYGLLDSELLNPTVTNISPFIIKRGVSGYYATDWSWKKEYAEQALKETNAKLGVDPVMAQKMAAWSMFGWPAHYRIAEAGGGAYRMSLVIEYPNKEAAPALNPQPCLGGTIVAAQFYDSLTLIQAMEQLLTTASHALRSYACGNASPDLANDVADKIDVALHKGPNERH